MQLNTVLLISGGLVQALQMLAALSLLILLHEFGHFFFARLFKTRVEKFYLFFDFLFPFPNVLNFALFKKKKGDTEYGLGWFPLGGYVKISGMVDESMDKEQMELPPEPWEYRSKKAYQRLFIMLGGIIMNVLVAMVIYAVLFGAYGEEYLPTKNITHGLMVDSTAKSIGLQNGDNIVAVGGKQIERFNGIVPELIVGEAKSLTIVRNGETKEIAIPQGTIKGILKRGKESNFIAPRFPLVIAQVDKGSAAAKMGFEKGDSVVAVNGTPTRFYDEFNDIKNATAGQPIAVTVVRNNQPLTLNGTVPATKVLGVMPKPYGFFFELEQKKYNPIEAIGKGFSYTFEQFGSYWKQFRMIFVSKEVDPNESLGGIVSFGKLFSPEFSMAEFLRLTAFISIILAFMNLLPIPGLDGGYVMFLLFELISGRKVSDKVMEKATAVGLILLLGVMLYANGLDIFRLFKN